MAEEPTTSPTLRLQAAYTTLYNEITEPDRVVVITQYFRRVWMPRLGPALAWLIIALRQRCYRNRKTGEVRNLCQVTQEELAAELGMEPRTVRRLLEQPDAGRFVIESKGKYSYDRELGKRVRTTTMYRIRMDDPLTPEDEDLLRQRLMEQAAGLTVDPTTGQQDMLLLLDQLLATAGDAADLPDKMSTSSHLPDKMSVRSGHLPDKMSTRSDHLPDILSGESPHLPDKMSGVNNSTIVNSTLLLTIPDHQQQHAPPTNGTGSAAGGGGGGDLTETDLADLILAPDEVLIKLNQADEADTVDKLDATDVPVRFRVQKLTKIVCDDLRRAHRSGSKDVVTETEVLYSVLHALGEGGEEWLPEELARIELRRQIEDELKRDWELLGAFSLEEALVGYFSPDLVQKFVADMPELERARIAGWVAYTRQAPNLRSPSGFLRTKIESKAEPPTLQAKGKADRR